MKYRQPFSLLALITILATVFITSSSFARKPVQAYIVINAENGAILAQSKATKTTYPASLTKVMTLLVLFEKLDQGHIKLNQQFLVSRHAASMPSTKIGLKRGDKITVEDAIEALIVHSANDVAVVIAENIAGSEAGFVQLMNAKAKQIGLTQTTFANASGLPHFRQVTTASDMAKLGLAVFREYPEYYQYFATKSFHYNNRHFFNHNTLLQKYDGADGLKTGYIRASGYNLITSAKQGSNRLIVVVMGAQSSVQRHQKMVQLLNTGFAKLKNNVPATTPTLMVAAPQNHAKKLLGFPPVKPTRQTTPSATTAPHAIVKTGDWGIQIGAFGTTKMAQEKLQKALKILGSAGIYQSAIQLYKTTNGKTLYRTRLVGLTQQNAKSACAKLIKNSFDCFVFDYKNKTYLQSASN
jgi:D-alanyl-D-alanine carboxypeptidase